MPHCSPCSAFPTVHKCIFNVTSQCAEVSLARYRRTITIEVNVTNLGLVEGRFEYFYLSSVLTARIKDFICYALDATVFVT